MKHYIKKSVKRTLLFILIMGIFYPATALTWLPYNKEFEFLGPWLTWNDDPKRTIVINWWLSQPKQGYVIVWNSTMRELILTKDARKVHHIKLEGLTPDSRYFYVVGVLENGEMVNLTRIYSFKTAPSKVEPFSFLVITDEQYHIPFLGSTEMAMKAIRNEKAEYDFIISVGDQVDSDKYEITWKRFFANLGDLAANRTIMPTIGNHEMIEWGSKHARNYLEFFALPGNETYYYFEYSNAVFVTVNFYDYENFTITPEEIQFLKDVITEAKAEGKWVFLYYHVPTITPFSTDFFAFSKKKLNENASKFLDFLKQLRPDVVFTGHEHCYSRVDVEGIKFIVLGSVGGIPEPIIEDTGDFHGYKVEAWNFEYGYMLVEVNENVAHFVYKSIYGEVLDEFSITR